MTDIRDRRGRIIVPGARTGPPWTRPDGYHWHVIPDLFTGEPQGTFGHEWARDEHPGDRGRRHMHRWGYDLLRTMGLGQGMTPARAHAFATELDGRPSGVGTFAFDPSPTDWASEREEILRELAVHPELRAPGPLRDVKAREPKLS